MNLMNAHFLGEYCHISVRLLRVSQKEKGVQNYGSSTSGCIVWGCVRSLLCLDPEDIFVDVQHRLYFGESFWDKTLPIISEPAPMKIIFTEGGKVINWLAQCTGAGSLYLKSWKDTVNGLPWGMTRPVLSPWPPPQDWAQLVRFFSPHPGRSWSWEQAQQCQSWIPMSQGVWELSSSGCCPCPAQRGSALGTSWVRRMGWTWSAIINTTLLSFLLWWLASIVFLEIE